MIKLNGKINWNQQNSYKPTARWSGKQKQTEDENFRLKIIPSNELMGCWHDNKSTITFTDNLFS